jgi:hypothetical protein
MKERNVLDPPKKQGIEVEALLFRKDSTHDNAFNSQRLSGG